MTSIFISYSSKDVKIADNIHKFLEKDGYNVWRDKSKIRRDWSKEIADALSRQDIILLIWTKNASESNYVKNEWMTARALGKLIKPILFSKDALSVELPKPLRNLQAIVDLETLDDAHKNIDKLIAVLEKVNSFTFDYNYNILPTKRNIRFLPNPDFVGRNEELIDLYLEMIGDLNKLNYQQIGLVGMPGLGKTQLAIEFGYRYVYQFEKGIYWIEGVNPKTWLNN